MGAIMIDKFIDETGVEHHISDFLPPAKGDADFIDSDNGQCCCGEYDCKESYEHWTSGF